MSSRALSTVTLAAVLIVIVMAVTAAMAWMGLANTAKFSQTRVWEVPFSEAQSMKILDFTGDGQDELFAQNTTTVALLDANGQARFGQDYSAGLNTTLGDVDGDGVEDIVVFHAAGVTVLQGAGQVLWEVRPDNLRTPYRSAVVRFAGGPQVLLGDGQGQVVALDARGQGLWRGATTITDYIRGLDDVRVKGVIHAAVANHNGMVVVFDERGRALWEYTLDGTLRRLRAYDLDSDGNGEILVGGDGSRLVLLEADTGAERFNRGLGQAITEIREAELDGEPSAREFVVGGKEGGVWAFRADGTRLWSASVSDQVSEIIALDVDDDGAEEVVIGDEAGSLTIFTGQGHRQKLASRPSDIARLDTGRLTGSDQLAVADLTTIQLLDVDKQTAPLWYSPLLAGLLVSATIAFAAWYIANIPPKPVLRVTAEDQSVEGLLARNRMLHESLADVERLRGTGEMPAEAYLARLRDLRGELAGTQAALQKAGQPIRLETVKCPSCGGALPIGMDKCDYCGQTVIA
ncbi:MAG: PQQ-binding-like beta-propeller repeat protein [Anaerolineales bacterium]|nr:PQQ-binding-like beta-propeller repeat protein [Anaerolineales bacterium]